MSASVSIQRISSEVGSITDVGTAAIAGLFGNSTDVGACTAAFIAAFISTEGARAVAVLSATVIGAAFLARLGAAFLG